jgi:hypothetical protein
MRRTVKADHVIDCTQEDFVNRQQHDLILAMAGYRSLLDYRRALSPEGTYVMVGGSMAQVFQAMLLGPALDRRGQESGQPGGQAGPRRSDLRRGHHPSIREAARMVDVRIKLSAL